MYSDGISKTGGLNNINPQKIEQQNSIERDSDKVKKSGHGLSQRDSAQISVDASEVSRYQELVRIHREAYGPSERTAKLDEVRQKIKDGYYDDPEIIDRLSDQLVENTAASRVKAENLDDVRNRKDEGFYDRPEVIEKTAENVIRNVMPGSKGR